MPQPEYFVVWNPSGRTPVYRHPSEPDARREAERLAAINPGQEFVVLRSICVSKLTAVMTEEYRARLPDEMPF